MLGRPPLFPSKSSDTSTIQSVYRLSPSRRLQTTTWEQQQQQRRDLKGFDKDEALPPDYDRNRWPFVGAAGNRTDKAFKRAGLGSGACDPRGCFVFGRGRDFLVHTDPRGSWSEHTSTRVSRGDGGLRRATVVDLHR